MISNIFMREKVRKKETEPINSSFKTMIISETMLLPGTSLDFNYVKPCLDMSKLKLQLLTL